MKLIPSDPDIATLVARIKDGVLDLQPDFQRGEVWSESKRRRLIDSILRNWYIPPIHVIERGEIQEVLDGQQRLAAIRDFINGKIKIDGFIEPFEETIVDANGYTYDLLPDILKRRINRFSIRVISLVDFKPDEPGELFFRLNQPTSLTAAEQRNAFYGPVREQVKELCKKFTSRVDEDFIGFSNSRMAYDDTLAKLCLILEKNTLLNKITASSITEKYRSYDAFSEDTIYDAEQVICILGECKNNFNEKYLSVKFNKATLLSWLCFLAREAHQFKNNINTFLKIIPEYLFTFESLRQLVSGKSLNNLVVDVELFPEQLLSIFSNKSSLSVADVSSVILRDSILAYCFGIFLQKKHPKILLDEKLCALCSLWGDVLSKSKYSLPLESELISILEKIKWGNVR